MPPPLLALLTLLASAPAAPQQPLLPSPVRVAADRIVAEQLARDLDYLSADALRGRDTFSPGLDSAAEFIIRRLRLAGLKPVGDGGTFLQHYTVLDSRADTSGTYVEVAGNRFRFGDVLAQVFSGPLVLFAPVVYVGHGWRIPSLKIDPYAGVDVKNKIVLAHGGTLPIGVTRASLPSDAEFTLQAASKSGAVALAFISSARALGMWNEFRSSPFLGAYRELDPVVPSAYAAMRFTSLLLKPEVTQALLAEDSLVAKSIIGRAPNADFPPSFQLARSMTINLPATAQRQRIAYNVVAAIEGSDPTLRREYVTIAAHLDGAVGSEPPVNGDSIYNAADDNASGSVGILAIAEQMMRAPRPRRSLLFIWDSGEEVGLWGTRAFVGKRIVPLSDIVTHVNVDMIGATRAPGRPDSAAADVAEANEVFIIGPRVLSAGLDSLLHQVNRSYVNMRLNQKLDTATNEFFYPRTDAGPFLERGIPIIEFFTGLHDRYHGPLDEARFLDPKKIEAIARTVFVTVWSVANAPQRPRADKGFPPSVPRYP